MNPQAASFITLAQWVPVLQRWLGLRHALVVGQGGLALLQLQDSLTSVTLFKASAGDLGLSNSSPHRAVTGWYASPNPNQYTTWPWLIAEHTGLCPFHLNSLSRENGLMFTKDLTECWPGIKSLGTNNIQALCLDDAFVQACAYRADKPDDPIHSANWLWLTCLPGFPLLRGATLLLNQIDVLAFRVQLLPGADPDVGLPATQEWLQDHGFSLCGVEPERNPKLGTALFVRNYPAAHITTQHQRDELARAQSELQAQLAAETEAKYAEATARAEAQHQRDELARAQSELQAQLAAETEAKYAEATARAEAQHQRDELARAQSELQAQLAAETEAKYAEATARAEAQHQRDELARTQSELQAKLESETQTKHAESNAKAEALEQRDELVKSHGKLQAQLRSETQTRQTEIDSRIAAQQHLERLTKDSELAFEQMQALLQEKTDLQTAHAQKAAQLQAMMHEHNAVLSKQEFLDNHFLTLEAQIDLIKQLMLGERMTTEAPFSDEELDLEVELDAGAPSNIDSKLLQRVMTQWQFGDWQSLVQLDIAILQNHPERAQLAIYAAAGHQQIGEIGLTHRFIRMAQVWGCEPILIKQLMLSGVHNTLGLAEAKLGNLARANEHFKTAIDIGLPGADRLVYEARTSYQIRSFEINPYPTSDLN